MASEMRRMARALIEHRAEVFPSRHPRAESDSRMKAALAAIAPRRLRFESRWREGPEGLALEAEFHPAERARRMLQAASLALAALIAVAAWAVISDRVGQVVAFTLALAAALAILGFPLALAGFGAGREAEEARLRKALARALTDEEG